MQSIARFYLRQNLVRPNAIQSFYRKTLFKTQFYAFNTVNPPDDEEIELVTKEERSIIGEGKEELTYSQEYYILNREDILQKRRQKEMEAKFGDFSARLVKRPKKDFLWGFGT